MQNVQENCGDRKISAMCATTYTNTYTNIKAVVCSLSNYSAIYVFLLNYVSSSSSTFFPNYIKI